MFPFPLPIHCHDDDKHHHDHGMHERISALEVYLSRLEHDVKMVKSFGVGNGIDSELPTKRSNGEPLVQGDQIVVNKTLYVWI